MQQAKPPLRKAPVPTGGRLALFPPIHGHATAISISVFRLQLQTTYHSNSGAGELLLLLLLLRVLGGTGLTDQGQFALPEREVHVLMVVDYKGENLSFRETNHFISGAA